MKIWIVQDGEPIPGIDKNTRDWRAAMLAKTLVARGHEVIWWASTFDHAHKRHRFSKPRAIELQPGLKVRLLHGPGYKRNTSPFRLWHQRMLARSLSREIAKATIPDLIFCSLPTLELAECCVKYGKNHTPVLIDVRDQWPDIYLHLFPSMFRWVARLLLFSEFRRAKKIFQKASGITAVSSTYLRWALKYAERQKYEIDGVFPLGYRLKAREVNENQQILFQQRYGIDPTSLIVSFVGTFGKSYDLKTIVKAARQLQLKERKDIQFVLAGDGDKACLLHQIAHDLSNVVFTGWLDQNSLQILLQTSDIGLASYGKNALQSLPNKPFEYMSAGLPILSSLPGELEEIIRDENIGLQYQAGDEESLVEKIIWLIEHPNERIAMAKCSRKLFDDRYKADVIYPKMVKHLERIATHFTNTGTHRESLQKEEFDLLHTPDVN